MAYEEERGVRYELSIAARDSKGLVVFAHTESVLEELSWPRNTIAGVRHLGPVFKQFAAGLGVEGIAYIERDKIVRETP